MKASLLFFLAFPAIAAHSQNTINNYKYVLVPQQFSFQKFEDQYQLNTTAKSLLEQKGFTVVWSNGQMPPALAANRCAALVADLTQRKAMFTTNLTLELKDCSGNVVFKGKEGRSREKEFYTAFDEALRDAFTTLKATPYNYDSAQVAQVKQPQQIQQAPLTQQPAATQQAPPSQQPAAATPAEAAGTLYAQPVTNGFQLIDTSPKKILTLLKTSLPDYFIAEGGPATGIVFKKDGEWLYEYYKDDKLMSQKLVIKF